MVIYMTCQFFLYFIVTCIPNVSDVLHCFPLRKEKRKEKIFSVQSIHEAVKIGRKHFWVYEAGKSWPKPANILGYFLHIINSTKVLPLIFLSLHSLESLLSLLHKNQHGFFSTNTQELLKIKLQNCQK